MSRKKTPRETLESLEEETVEEQRRQKCDNASFADESLGGAFGKPQDRGRFGDLSRGGRPRGKDRGWAAEPEQKRQTSGHTPKMWKWFEAAAAAPKTLPVSRNISEGKPLGKRARNQKIKKFNPAAKGRLGGGFASYVRIKGRMVYCDFSIDTTVTIGKSTIAALAHYATNRTAVTSSAMTPVTATMIGKSIPCPRWTTIIARIRRSLAVFDRLPPTGMCGAEPAGVVANRIRTQ